MAVGNYRDMQFLNIENLQNNTNTQNSMVSKAQCFPDFFDSKPKLQF